MKTIKLFLLGLITVSTSYGQINTQSKIDQALGQSFATQTNQVSAVIEELNKDQEKNAYWLGYGYMLSGVYYMSSNDQEQVEESINRGIELMETINEQDSETSALHGFLIALSISYNGANAARLSSQAFSKYKTAAKLDPNNMRAYLGLAENDLYTPEQYGGGKTVEKDALKALELSNKTSSNVNAPTWGKNRVYFILASFYQRTKQTDKAKMYCMQGLSQFPNDYQLNQVKSSF